MSTDTRISFLGIPVEGDITKGEQRKDQRPRSEFESLVKALLDDPTIHSFGWTQYTPYFNDGDPCVFGATGIWVKTMEDIKSTERPTHCEVCGQPLPQGEEDSTEEDDEDEEVDEEVDEEDGPYSVGYEHRTLGRAQRLYSHQDRTYHFDMTTYVGPDIGRYERCVALDLAVECGQFDDVLLDLFGDHAKIKVTREGITVTFYDHD